MKPNRHNFCGASDARRFSFHALNCLLIYVPSHICLKYRRLGCKTTNQLNSARFDWSDMLSKYLLFFFGGMYVVYFNLCYNINGKRYAIMWMVSDRYFIFAIWILHLWLQFKSQQGRLLFCLDSWLWYLLCDIFVTLVPFAVWSW